MPPDLDPAGLAASATGATAAPPPPRPRLHRLLRGPEGDPSWARPALFALLGATALLYLWGLGASGFANDFYAAAVQAGTRSWKALFFGSLDSSNFITVDKPPASLWVMALSGRIFGFSSWSMLAPQALEGVAAVGVLYAPVRRWFGPVAALFAGAAFALTPVAALMFRFNNPDALLTLLLVVAAYCLVRAIETAGTRWLLLCGVAVGFGFLTKMLQAAVVVPVFGLVYLIAAPTGLGRRIAQLLGAAAAMVAAAGWWVAITELWPKSSRPFVGGSTTNSVLQLAFGYNGFSRILGNRGGGPGGGGGFRGGPGGGGGGFGGAPGWTRLFNSSWGGQIAWLLPAALVAFAAGLWLTRRAPRTDRARAALLLWGGWLLITAATFSFATGIVHEYYAVALAPAIGALVAIVGVRLWQLRRHDPFARLMLAAMLAAAGVTAFVLLDRTPNWHPGLRVLVAVATVVAVAALLVGERVRAALPSASASPRPLTAGLAVVAVVAVFAGSAAYAQDTVATTHGGSTPSAGPSSTGGFGFRGFGGGQFPGVPGGGGGGTQAQPPTVPFPGGGNPGGGFGGGGGGGGADSALVALLKADAGRSTWAAATVGSQSAAPLELASGQAVMAIGGFGGGDPAPTLAQFQQDVANHKIHYFVGGGRGGGFGGPGGGQGTASQITAWVSANFATRTVGGETVYDLTQPKTGSSAAATTSSA